MPPRSDMAAIPLSQVLAYGAFSLPLSLIALPVYMVVPPLYVAQFGLPLTLIGSLLLATRLLDAFIDPAIGRWVDRRPRGVGHARFILIALPFLAGGALALLRPPVATPMPPAAWLCIALMLVYAGFSVATIAHQSWGAALTQAIGERSRLTGWREAFGLVGVMTAAVVPVLAGMDALLIVFGVALASATTVLIARAPRPGNQPAVVERDRAASVFMPFGNRLFRWLFSVFVCNGIAAAIPATLFLFFCRDKLQREADAGLFLLVYFGAAALSTPLWGRLARRHGEARSWLIGMLLAIVSFAWAFVVPPGAVAAFGIICLLSGVALGADLALPPALLAGIIGKAGHSGTREGAYFGIWNWATKINLALAAGLSLPLLDALGYVPGQADARALLALTIAYSLLPCALKLLAAWLLWRAPLHTI